ncbi:flagellar biosynthesis anti-sigma factor FlgM [Aurantivibrio infirmus]
MNIDPNNRVPAAGSDNPRNKAASQIDARSSQQSKVKTESNAAEQDKVDLSPEAQTLKSLEARIRASADIDGSRVAEIKRAIANGSFEINVERIAERLLQQEELLGK